MRIRSVKPEFWRSADMVVLDYFTRLFFIGLWNYVDDNGVGEDSVTLIRSDLFPREEDINTISARIHGALNELSKRGQIARYADSRNGRHYLYVQSWRHQRINRPTESDKPLPTSEFASLHEDSVSTHVPLTEPSVLDQGNKGMEQGRGDDALSDPPPLRCKKHIDTPDPPSCGGCADARRFHERWKYQQAQAERRRRQAELDIIAACPLCDFRGLIELDEAGTSRRCTHEEVSA